MTCYYCGKGSDVFNTRAQQRTGFIWRRRRCQGCKAVWTTVEAPEWATLFVVTNKHSKTEPFLRDILFLSIYESCKHRKRAVSDATALTEVVLGKLNAVLSDGKLAKTEIAKAVSDVLKNFDKTAYTLYAAYHLPL